MYLSVVSSHQLLAEIFFWFCQIELRDTWIKLNDDVMNEKMSLLKYQIWKCSLNLYNYWTELMARITLILLFYSLFFCLKAGPFLLFCRLNCKTKIFGSIGATLASQTFKQITMECCLVVMCILIGWNFGKSVLQCSPKPYRLAA